MEIDIQNLQATKQAQVIDVSTATIMDMWRIERSYNIHIDKMHK